jgi:5-methylcytosine-specific restriction endonuclease McrA
VSVYSEKLRDPRWQRRRLEVMHRDDFTCCRCRSADKILNVNHLVYSGEPRDAPTEALETLCEDCHGERSALERELRALPTFLAIHIMRQAMRDAMLPASRPSASPVFVVAV